MNIWDVIKCTQVLSRREYVEEELERLNVLKIKPKSKPSKRRRGLSLFLFRGGEGVAIIQYMYHAVRQELGR
jgi:hypothetical protein